MDALTNLENVNNEVQKAGAGDKRNRNEAIRRGLENPGLYQTTGVQPNGLDQTLSSLGSQSTQDPAWIAPSSWGQYSADQEKQQYDEYVKKNASMLPGQFGDGLIPELLSPEQAGYKITPLSEHQKTSQDMGMDLRSKGFVPGASGNGWSWNPGISAPGSMKHNEDALREEGGGYWEKNNPKAYKGQGSDYIWYSPSRGYQTSHYYKTPPEAHGLAGFMSSPMGTALSMFAGGMLGGAGGLGGLFGAAEGGAAGMGGALGNGITLGAAGTGIGGGALGSGISLGSAGAGIAGGLGSGLSAGAGLAGVMGGANGASALSSGGLFGKGGILGTGIDTGSGLANSGIENFGKSLITSGGDVKKSGINAITGGLSSGLGGLFNNDISKYISSISKPLIGNALSGGDFQSGLKNALFGGASAGLGDMLNSTDLMSGNTQEKAALANNVTSLAKTLSRKRKVA